MLAIHWSPVKNTNAIRRNGIRKGRRGLFCFPLTGHAHVDRWWERALRSWEPRTQYNGFVFRIAEEDLPAKFCDWLVDCMGFADAIDTLRELEEAYRKTLVWKIGATYCGRRYDDFTAVGERLIHEDPTLYARNVADPKWMNSAFFDYQIILSHSIAPERIIRVMPGSAESGRARVRGCRECFDPLVEDWAKLP